MTEWISVKDRLPEVEESRLFLLKDRNEMFIGKLRKHTLYEKYMYAIELDVGYDESFSVSEVTHWMPLPELPNGMD